MRSVFSVPPLPDGMEVVGFRLVPTTDKEKCDLAGACIYMGIACEARLNVHISTLHS